MASEIEPVLSIGLSDARRREFVDVLQKGPRLQQQIFMPMEEFRSIPHEDDQVIKIEPEPADERLYIPAVNFVSAVAFKSWKSGRQGRKHGRSSRALIKEYAKQNTLAPALGRIDGYLQPSGLTIYGATGDGSHRVAAAIKRKDLAIGVIGPVVLTQIQQNYIEL